jgi:curved DNA-binding protein CbpA
MKRKNPYEVLKVDRDATIDEIKKSYRSLLQQTHPDTNPGNEDKYAEVIQARALIGSVSAKRKFDSGEQKNEDPNNINIKKLMTLNRCIGLALNDEECNVNNFEDVVLHYLNKEKIDLLEAREMLSFKKRNITKIIREKYRGELNKKQIKAVGDNIIDEINSNLNTIKEALEIHNACDQTVYDWLK